MLFPFPKGEEEEDNEISAVSKPSCSLVVEKTKKQLPNWTNHLCFGDETLKNVVAFNKMQLVDHNDPFPSLPCQETLTLDHKSARDFVSRECFAEPQVSDDNEDLVSLLSDFLLLRILSLLPHSQHASNSLVCKRWFFLLGRLRRSLTLFDWRFLATGRMAFRFPNLTRVNLVPASIHSSRSSGIFLTLPSSVLSIPLHCDFLSAGRFVPDKKFLSHDSIDAGLEALARGCPNVRSLALVATTETGLASVAFHCLTVQELELHRCTDAILPAVAFFGNLQILRVIGAVEGLYDSAISDVGLTILAHGCLRLVKLELSGCEGSYDGITAVGTCCPMLEEFALSDHRMDCGWLAALSSCGNLKTLRLEGCKVIDNDPGSVEHLGSCPTLETLQLRRCQLRDKRSFTALLIVCGSVREIDIHNCWGLDNDMFGIAKICRRVKFLSLESCSLLTTVGVESVLLSWKELERLRVVSCNSIQDNEVSAALSSLFSILKEFKWQPDSRSVLVSALAGTGMRTKGGRFFNRA